MTVTTHDKIVRVLYELCNEYQLYKKVYADHISQDYKCISILTELSRRTPVKAYAYNPDLWCKYKNGISVYEVWDNQAREACVEDILFTALTPNIRDLSIVCIQEFQYELAKELTEVILNSLYNEDSELLINPKEKLLIALIPDNLKNHNELKQHLYKKLKFDK